MEPTKPFGNLTTRNNIFIGNRYVVEYMGSTLTGPVDMDYDNLYTPNLPQDMPRFVKWLNKRYADLKALAAGTGYQSNYRYGSHQSITRSWLPPMHQTDSLFHKQTGAMKFVFGFAVDNHGVNTVPKETLVRITKAEDGGLGGVGAWKPATTGCGPGNESDEMKKYLSGGYTKLEKTA